MAESPDLAQHAERRIAALRQLLERLQTQGRVDDAASRAVRELLTESFPDAKRHRSPDARPHL
jgi:hypothetical protein